MKDYYGVLQIKPLSTAIEIKKAYHILAIKYHPDKNFDIDTTDIFLEIKEAYEFLIVPENKSLYDKNFTGAEENISEERKYNENTFFENQYRINNETISERPSYDFWNKRIDAKFLFIKYPKRIGKILLGYSTMLEGIDYKNKFKRDRFFFITMIFLSIIGGLIISSTIYKLYWYYILGWSVILYFISLVIYSRITGESEIEDLINAYVGINGFAKFRINRSNLAINLKESIEINFSEITDLITAQSSQYYNFIKIGKDYHYYWCNENKIVYQVYRAFAKKEGIPKKSEYDFWLNNTAEKYWTIYLLDKINKELDEKGFLTFNFYTINDDAIKLLPWLKIGPGFISWTQNNIETVYKINDIERLVLKNGWLSIVNKKYDMKMYFFKEHKKLDIPIAIMTNRAFFFKSIEILLGYKFN